MNRNIVILLLALVFLMPYADVNARRRKKKKQRLFHTSEDMLELVILS